MRLDNAWIPSQFDNPSNPSIHETTTAREILADFPEGIDYLVTGVGTGGHITGVTRILKQQMPDIKVFAVEPADSQVIGGGEPGPHGIMGIGAGFIPEIWTGPCWMVFSPLKKVRHMTMPGGRRRKKEYSGESQQEPPWLQWHILLERVDIAFHHSYL